MHSDTARQILWDPTTGLVAVDRSNNILGVNSAATIFLHEAAHAIDKNFVVNFETNNVQFGNEAERYAVELTSPAILEAGEPVRDNHSGMQILTDSVTISAIKSGTDAIWKMFDGDMEFSIQMLESDSFFADWAPFAGGENWLKKLNPKDILPESKIETPFSLHLLFANHSEVEDSATEIISYPAELVGVPSFDAAAFI